MAKTPNIYLYTIYYTIYYILLYKRGNNYEMLPLSDSARDNGCSSCGKDVLEKPLWVIVVLHWVVEVPVRDVHDNWLSSKLPKMMTMTRLKTAAGNDGDESWWERIEDSLRTAAEVVALRSIGETPADRPVGGGADERVQHVLDQDVHRVLWSGYD